MQSRWMHKTISSKRRNVRIFDEKDTGGANVVMIDWGSTGGGKGGEKKERKSCRYLVCTLLRNK